ncbi:MAG: hypothetical protein M3Q73_00395 [bacterium]|nr:hypothetical protein [bacterium]
MPGKPASNAQIRQILATLLTTTDFDRLDEDTAQQIIAGRKKTGKNFTDFLLNGGNMIVGSAPRVIKIDRSIPFDIVAFAKKYEDQRSNSDCLRILDGWEGNMYSHVNAIPLEHIDLMKIKKITYGGFDRRSIKLEKRLVKLIPSAYIPLDAHAFIAIWENRHLIPIEWQRSSKDDRLQEFTFDGTIFHGPQWFRERGGMKSDMLNPRVDTVLHMHWYENEWKWRLFGLDNQVGPWIPTLVY